MVLIKQNWTGKFLQKQKKLNLVSKIWKRFEMVLNFLLNRIRNFCKVEFLPYLCFFPLLYMKYVLGPFLECTREKWTNLNRVQWRAKKMMTWQEHYPEVRQRDLALVSLEKSRWKEDEARLFQWCPVTRHEANVTNRNTGGSTQTFRNKFFTVWVTVLSQRLFREVLQFPSLETIRNYLQMLLGILVFYTGRNGICESVNELQHFYGIQCLRLLWLFKLLSTISIIEHIPYGKYFIQSQGLSTLN